MLIAQVRRPAAARWLSKSTLAVSSQRALHLPAPRNNPIVASAFGSPRPCPQYQPRSILKYDQRRAFLTALPTVLVPPVVFAGLLLALWTYKCFMTVVFQEKILYMSYMPPQTRSEKIEDYAVTCKPVEWEQRRIKSLDGTNVSLAVGSIPLKDTAATLKPDKEVVICYFQGNGGSTPPRLPLLSNTLKLLHSRASSESVCHTMVALSYRGYWTSSGRATEAGIKLDAQAALAWVKENHPDASIVLWGQSLGAGVACAAAAEHLAKSDAQKLQGLVLETPFTSVKSMLLALYPERWLPYRYLAGFLRSHWDSEQALIRVSDLRENYSPDLSVLLVAATRDEVVPAEEAGKIQNVCKQAKLPIERVNVIGALHNEATTRREGQEAVARFILNPEKE